MPKNKGKGGKNRRRGKNENDNVKRELTLKEDGQSYAQVTRILGNGYVEAFCFDSAGGKKRICHIRGKLRKKQWINQGDVILVGLRDYEDGKADIIWKYLADEARELKRTREIPDNININETNDTNIPDDIIFDERHTDEESSDDQQRLPNNINNRLGINGSLSEEESDDDDDDEEDINMFHNPNRMPIKTGNLNAGNLLKNKKDSGKGARNNRRDVISGSDTEEKDEIANI